MYRFLGKIEVKTDNKGRVFIPASYRKLLERSGEEILLLRVDEVNRCISVYPESVWEKRNEELTSKLNLWDTKDMMLYRKYTSETDVLEIDASGRILLQKKYLDLLKIESSALFVGTGECFEIWSKDVFDAFVCSPEEFEQGIQERMGNQPQNREI